MADDFERPKLEPIHDKWRLTEDWHTDCKGLVSGKLTIHRGFVTDGASIPRFLWRLCGSPMDLPRVYAAIVHDYIYTYPHTVEINDGNTAYNEKWSRKKADGIYRDYQIALGVSRCKAYTEYYALRVFGGGHWDDEGE